MVIMDLIVGKQSHAIKKTFLNSLMQVSLQTSEIRMIQSFSLVSSEDAEFMTKHPVQKAVKRRCFDAATGVALTQTGQVNMGIDSALVGRRRL